MTLYTAGPDGVFGTGDDCPADSTVTDANGNYIFDDLPPGAYVVEVTPPPAATPRPATPISSAQPAPPATTRPRRHRARPRRRLPERRLRLPADVRSQRHHRRPVWFDAGRGRRAGRRRVRHPRRHRALIKDSNGNGQWDAGETDHRHRHHRRQRHLPLRRPATGSGGDYLVWVNDTDNVLGDLTPTSTRMAPRRRPASSPAWASARQLNLAGDVTDHDFGYTPPSHETGDGLIGDTIFLDNGNGDGYQPRRGHRGRHRVPVRLDGTTLLATTDDRRERPLLLRQPDPPATYVVKVDTTHPAQRRPGLTNTVDPDGGTGNQSTVTLASRRDQPAAGLRLRGQQPRIGSAT